MMGGKMTPKIGRITDNGCYLDQTFRQNAVKFTEFILHLAIAGRPVERLMHEFIHIVFPTK
ncbi:hypothetical protein AO703_09015 [[Enterobacter] lignolyticus]|uniref:Uncharacterized protein n=1 Tax=[Enterobacter] lignolyticus TaxID=1334193 RepID=A0A806X433_9ENTR|nr:hypothetical protein AO703_09015 [[Enterobacter] lignolyticus]